MSLLARGTRRMESGWVSGKNVPLYYLQKIHLIILEPLLIDLDWVQKSISLILPPKMLMLQMVSPNPF